MNNPNTFSDFQLNGLSNDSLNSGVPLVEVDLLTAPIASTGENALRDGVLVDTVRLVDDQMLTPHNLETPTISNISQQKSFLGESNMTSTSKRTVNMPDPRPMSPSTEILTEATQDLLFELGYDSDGEPPYFGNAEEELSLMEAYNESPISEVTSVATDSSDEAAGSAATATENIPVLFLFQMQKLTK